MEEANAYILGTDKEELFRLGVQHHVWASEAINGWDSAGFGPGQNILDLGCGPGYCSEALAYRVGSQGKVLAVDMSEHYTNYLKIQSRLKGLKIETICADFRNLQLPDRSIDGVYCRWALAWISEVKQVLIALKKALKPGGKLVLHEYYDWSTMRCEPHLNMLSKGIDACFQSFKNSDSEIDIGRYLPAIMEELGLNIISYRVMNKLMRPGDFSWLWPKSFFYSYFPRLIKKGLLSEKEASQALEDFEKLENMSSSSINGPIMVELIAQKAPF